MLHRTCHATATPKLDTVPAAPSAHVPTLRVTRADHTVEIVSDPGEGTEKCGQIFGHVSARMGSGVWTVEIIPADIQPPARTPPAGATTGSASARVQSPTGATAPSYLASPSR